SDSALYQSPNCVRRCRRRQSRRIQILQTIRTTRTRSESSARAAARRRAVSRAVKAVHSRVAVLVGLWLVLLPPGASAQTQAPPFEPTYGQPGKDVVWVPTPQALVETMLDVMHVVPQDYLIDLGSGDGRTVIAAAKRGATAVGIEYNPDMVELSKR